MPSSPRLPHRARLYGFDVRSDLPLRLAAFREREASGRPLLRVSRLSRRPLASARWFHEIRDSDGNLECRFGRASGFFLVDYPGLALFRIRSDGRRIGYLPARSVGERDVAALVLTQALPLAVQLSGLEVLHAAAVRIGNGAVAFLGAQGQGKSSLAAAFHSLAYPVLSDDALPLRIAKGRYYATPGVPEIRLYASTGKRLLGKEKTANSLPALRKFRTSLGAGFQRSPLPLRALFCLETADRLSIHRLGPGEACQRLLSHSFRVELDNAARLQKEFFAFAALVERVPVFCLKYPRGLGSLGKVARAVVRALES